MSLVISVHFFSLYLLSFEIMAGRRKWIVTIRVSKMYDTFRCVYETSISVTYRFNHRRLYISKCLNFSRHQPPLTYGVSQNLFHHFLSLRLLDQRTVSIARLTQFPKRGLPSLRSLHFLRDVGGVTERSPVKAVLSKSPVSPLLSSAGH